MYNVVAMYCIIYAHQDVPVWYGTILRVLLLDPMVLQSWIFHPPGLIQSTHGLVQSFFQCLQRSHQVDQELGLEA
jgi:hypothetical protein